MSSLWPLSVGNLPTCSTTPGRLALLVPKTPDQPHSRHFCSLCGFLVRGGQEQEEDPGDLPHTEQRQHSPWDQMPRSLGTVMIV